MQQRLRGFPRIAISSNALSAFKPWTLGIQPSFQFTSSFIGLKMPNHVNPAARLSTIAQRAAAIHLHVQDEKGPRRPSARSDGL